MKKGATVRLVPKLSIDGKKTAVGAAIVIDVVLTIILMAVIGAVLKVQCFHAGYAVMLSSIPTGCWKLYVWSGIVDCYEILG